MIKKSQSKEDTSETNVKRKTFGVKRRHSFGDWNFFHKPSSSKEEKTNGLTTTASMINLNGPSEPVSTQKKTEKYYSLRPLKSKKKFSRTSAISSPSFTKTEVTPQTSIVVDNHLGIKDHTTRKVEISMNIIRLLLSNLQMETECVDLLVQQMESMVPLPEQTKNLVLKETEKKTFKTVAQEIKEFLNNESKLRKLIKAQAFVRGWLARKRIPPGKCSKEQRRVNEVYFDLLALEKTYLHQLDIIILKYFEPLKKAINENKPILPQQELNLIFGNVETIRNLHQSTVPDLEILRNSWPSISGIGTFFLNLAPKLKCYSKYISNYKSSVDTLERAQSDIPLFANFLQQTQSGPANLLDSLMSLPINHISQYVELLARLNAQDISFLPDNEALIDSYVILEKLSNVLKTKLEKSRNTSTILEVQRKLVFHGKLEELNLLESNPNRFFIKEGNFTLTKTQKNIKKKNKVHIFLFNDIMLITKTVSKGHLLKESLELIDYTLIPSEEEEIANSRKEIPKSTSNGSLSKSLSSLSNSGRGSDLKSLSFQLQSNEKNYSFSTSVTEYFNWIQKLKEIVVAANEKKVIGCSLEELIQREQSPTGIPKIVERLASHLYSKGLHTEGLFRVSPSFVEVENMRKEVDKGNVLDFTQTDPHAVAGLFKLYFRELPQPLLTFDLYESFVKLSKTVTISSENELIPAIKTILQQLPLPNQHLLEYLMAFLANVCSTTELNKMSGSNLAVIFGPCLLRPKVENLTSTLDIPSVNNLVQYMIENYNLIFKS